MDNMYSVHLSLSTALYSMLFFIESVVKMWTICTLFISPCRQHCMLFFIESVVKMWTTCTLFISPCRQDCMLFFIS